MKRNVNVWDYAGHIIEQMKSGILLTAKADGPANPMTIGWGTLALNGASPSASYTSVKAAIPRPFWSRTANSP